jgi:uncharacterized membrane protein YfcA
MPAVAVIAVVVGAVAQAASGLGFALVCGPVLIATLGQHEGVRVAVLLSAGLNAVMLAREFRAVRWVDGAYLLVPAVVATPLLVPLVDRMDTTTASLVAGVLTVLAAVALLVGLRVPMLRGRAGAAVAGVVGASMNVVAAISGPAVALYTGNADWSAPSVRATMQAIFLLLNVVLLAVKGVPSVSGWLVVAVAGGYAAGVLLTRWMTDEVARRATLLLAAAGGAALVARAAL